MVIKCLSSISTPTVNYSYSTLPTFTSTQIGYRVDYTFPTASQPIGDTLYPLSLGVGVWMVCAYVETNTNQTSDWRHGIVVGSVRQTSLAPCAPKGGLYIIQAPVSCIVTLTATTTVNYFISWTVAATISVAGSVAASRYYAVRIA